MVVETAVAEDAEATYPPRWDCLEEAVVGLLPLPLHIFCFAGLLILLLVLFHLGPGTTGDG
ncbi:MAG: hypothetical protein ACKPKO_12805, partial [Candidatus Fonsibacter sp.]